MAPEMLTTREVAAWLRRSEYTLIGWRYHRVGPPYYRVGGSIVYRRSDVERWLTANSSKPLVTS